MSWQQRAEQAWDWLSEDTFLTRILALLGLILLLSLVLPQAPVFPADKAAFSRWLAEVQPALGRWTAPLTTLGWLSLRSSLWQRSALALLSLAVAVRAAGLVESWPQLVVFERVRRSMICVGGCLLLLGWGMQMTWGWVEPAVITWPGESLILPEQGLTLSPPTGTRRWLRRGYGLYLLHTDTGIGLEAQAWDNAGDPVLLQASTQSAPQESLRLALSAPSPEAYFALPSADLVFRANMQAPPPAASIQIQIYRSSTGELVTETTLSGSGDLFTSNLRLHLESTPLPCLRVIYNPGAPLTALGWLLLAVAGMGKKWANGKWRMKQMTNRVVSE
jgi:hypothetical protein